MSLKNTMTTQKKQTIKQIRQELTLLGVKIPNKGSGTNQGVLKSDLLTLLQNTKKEKEQKEHKKRISTYSLSDLNREMKHLDLNKPKKGSGKGGRVVKADLIRLIDQKKEENKLSVLPEGAFFKSMPADLLRSMLVTMDIFKVVKICQLNKYTLQTVCNENFWKLYVKSKDYITEDKGEYKTWKEFAIKERPYGSDDLYDIGRKIKLGLMTKKEAEDFLLKDYTIIEYKGSPYYIVNLRDSKNDELLDEMQSYPNSYGSGSESESEDFGYGSGREPEEINIEPYQFYYDYIEDDILEIEGIIEDTWDIMERDKENNILIYDSEWDGSVVRRW